MRKTGVWIALGCWLVGVTVAVAAGTRNAGLWEITSLTTFQQSPFDSGAPGGPGAGGKHTTQVCLTQEMIDKYGALLPQSRGNCQIENKVMEPGGMKADWVCNGKISGKGALESVWADAEHSKGKVHFVGTYQNGAETRPIEFITESTAAFKSADCGNVKPMALPAIPH